MALEYADFVAETGATLGTSATVITLASSADTERRSFAQAVTDGHLSASAEVVVGFVQAGGIATWLATYNNAGGTLTKISEIQATGTVADGAVSKVSLVPDAETFWSSVLGSGGINPGGRLTLESGVSISTTDQTAKTTVYYTPHIHNRIALWNGSRYEVVEFSETSLALGTISSTVPYDIFGYLSSGALALEKLAWTSETSRATAVVVTNGRAAKSGDETRLYLGSFFPTSTTTTEDSESNRLIYNEYNKAERALSYTTEDYGHTWTGTKGYRAYDNNSSHRLQVMTGRTAFSFVTVGGYIAVSSGSNSVAQIGCDLNETSDTDGQALGKKGSNTIRAVGAASYNLDARINRIQLTERNTSASDTISLSFATMGGYVKC